MSKSYGELMLTPSAITTSWILLISILFIGQSFASSFDCGMAKTNVEKMICRDSDLSKLDEELANAYHNMRATHAPDVALEDQQKKWLYFRDLCRNIDCVRRAYVERITELNPEPVISKSPLSISLATKNVLNRLSTSAICKLAFDDNFNRPRSACLETTEDGSCLTWGEMVNRDNYRELLIMRNISERACKEFDGVYLFGSSRPDAHHNDSPVTVHGDVTDTANFLTNKFKEHNLVLSSSNNKAHDAKCVILADDIRHYKATYLEPDVATDEYENTSTEHFRAYCPNTDYSREELPGRFELDYTASKAFEFYEIPKQVFSNILADHFILYAEGWRRIEGSGIEKRLTYAWAGGFLNGGIFRVVDKRTCDTRILFNGSARYDYVTNMSTKNRSGLFGLKRKLHAYSFEAHESDDGSTNAYVTVEAYNDKLELDYRCIFKSRSEVQNEIKQQEQWFQEEYDAAKKYSHPNNIPMLCDHNGVNMFSCARDNSGKMQSYHLELIYITAIHKIPKDNERKFIEKHKIRFTKVVTNCSTQFYNNSPEGTWATNVCIYTDLVAESNKMLNDYWR